MLSVDSMANSANVNTPISARTRRLPRTLVAAAEDDDPMDLCAEHAAPAAARAPKNAHAADAEDDARGRKRRKLWTAADDEVEAFLLAMAAENEAAAASSRNDTPPSPFVFTALPGGRRCVDIALGGEATLYVATRRLVSHDRRHIVALASAGTDAPSVGGRRSLTSMGEEEVARARRLAKAAPTESAHVLRYSYGRLTTLF